ncbi:MAG: Gfo/Idh/MocA family oxidoreductase [Oscillospiraceae bacterium]|nr:Gfo/Idh/MocA family oxidoreductase [Oscillospiraceae bacterium]
MSKIRIGVLCPSEIAFRRFMPALKTLDGFEYIGLAAATEREFSDEDSDEVRHSELEKAEKFAAEHSGKIFRGYESLISSDEIEAVYIPLPPALHFKWAKKALENGKHVLLEKPFTTSLEDTKELVSIAEKQGLAVHENYMFAYHTQLDWVKEQISGGAIGDVRLIRIDFGFPFRGANDFRYCKALGGGALLDCGGYTLKLASMLLGDSARVTDSQLCGKEGFEVDICGSATLKNDGGLTAQVSFGMDNSYRCSLDIWGSTGSIYTNRILTAPAGYKPVMTVRNADGEKTVELPDDDTFRKSIEAFAECIADMDKRKAKFAEIVRQSELVDKFERD